jgi:hypothetical protein
VRGAGDALKRAQGVVGSTTPEMPVGRKEITRAAPATGNGCRSCCRCGRWCCWSRGELQGQASSGEGGIFSFLSSDKRLHHEEDPASPGRRPISNRRNPISILDTLAFTLNSFSFILVRHPLPSAPMGLMYAVSSLPPLLYPLLLQFKWSHRRSSVSRAMREPCDVVES